MDLPGMDKYLDFWDFMAYDYAGSWDNTAGHQSNLFPDPKNPISTPFNTADAIDYYINVGKIAPEKLNLGLPLYGRAFAGTEGPGSPYTSIGEGHSWDQGVWDYKAVPEGKVVELPELGASYMYDADKKYMVTYDTPNIARQKAKWIKEKKLGGALFWEVSGDKEGDESLAGTVVKEFGKLENSTNHLSYPQSEYQMLRDGKKDEPEEMEVKEDEKGEEIEAQNAPIEEPTTEVGAFSLTSTFSPTSIPPPTTTWDEVVDEPTAAATLSTISSADPEPSLTATQFENFEIESAEWYEHHEEEERQEEEEEIDGTEEKRSHAEESKREKDGVPGAVFKKTAKPSGSSGTLAPTTSLFGVAAAGVVLLLLL
jgi:chitinase